METTVSVSTATTRSITVRPRMRRSTLNATPRKVRIAAAMRICSAKGFLQMFLERTGDSASCFVRISCFDVEPMNKEIVALDVDHERSRRQCDGIRERQSPHRGRKDRKSTRLNSSHLGISYAVFCLKKKSKMNE